MSSDELVHRLYERADVKAEVTGRFGDDVLDATGAVDRARLGPRAFAEPGGIAFLEGVIHPRVAGERQAWMERGLVSGAPLLVCEVPLLFEVGAAREFDAVLVVTAPEDVRRARVAARGQDFDQRAARQWPEERKVAAADEVFVNDGDLDELRAWAAGVVRRYGVPAGDGPG